MIDPHLTVLHDVSCLVNLPLGAFLASTDLWIFADGVGLHGTNTITRRYDSICLLEKVLRNRPPQAVLWSKDLAVAHGNVHWNISEQHKEVA